MIRDKDKRTILIVGDTIDGRLSTGAQALAGQARQLASAFAPQAVGVLFGNGIGTAARNWARMAGIPTIAFDGPQHRHPNAHNMVADLDPVVANTKPAAICLAHSMRASQAAAGLAWRMDAACVTAVEEITTTPSGVILKRAVFGGKFCETWTVGNRPLVLTLLPGALKRAAASPTNRPDVSIHPATTADNRCVTRHIHRQPHTDQALGKARVIVAGGRGLGNPEAVPMLQTVAGMFKDAAVGGSRGACDLGWLPHSLQIGETGQTVAPALYLACGISGAPQHLAGMRDSQTIVAVNTDSQAAIRNLAHYVVEEDLRTFLPLLRERYTETFTKGEADEN